MSKFKVDDIVNVYDNNSKTGVTMKGVINEIIEKKDESDDTEIQNYKVNILKDDDSVEKTDLYREDYLDKFVEPLTATADPITATADPITATADPITAAAAVTTVTPSTAGPKGGYSFVGGNIFKVTQEAGKGTCVIPSNAEEVKNDTDFITMMKTTLRMSGGSRSAKKNKTCKKKGGKKHKKSQKHKKAAKKC